MQSLVSLPSCVVQRDNVCSMVRMGMKTKVRPSLETLAKYVKGLLNRKSAGYRAVGERDEGTSWD